MKRQPLPTKNQKILKKQKKEENPKIEVCFTIGSKSHDYKQIPNEDPTVQQVVESCVSIRKEQQKNSKLSREREGYYLLKKLNPSDSVSGLTKYFARGYSIFAPLAKKEKIGIFICRNISLLTSRT